MADPNAPPLHWLWADPDSRRRAWRYWIRDPFNGLWSNAIHYGGRAMPIDWCSGYGAWLGELARRYSGQYNGQRVRLRENWARLKPDGTDPAQPHPVRDSAWRHVGRVASEFAILDRLWAAGRIAVEGAEHVAAARATGRPVIVTAIHTGNWEVISPSLIGLGIPVTAIYQPQGNRFERRILVRARARYGVTLVQPGRGGTLPAYRALLARKSVLLIHIDELIRGRVHAPAFGRPLKLEGNIANTARMQAMANAVVVPAYAVRLEGAHFKVTYLPPVDLQKTDDAEADLAANVARLDALVEPIIHKHLEQWFMLFEFRFDR